MTDLEKRFFDLATESERLKEQQKKISEELSVVMDQLKIGTYLQDPTTGLVYKIEVPNGTFIEFKKIGYKRTAKPGEKGGTVLAKSEAESMGFILPMLK